MAKSLAASLLQTASDDLESLLEVPSILPSAKKTSLPFVLSDETDEETASESTDEHAGTPSSLGRIPAQVLTDSVNLALLEQLYNNLSSGARQMASREKRVPPPTLPPATPEAPDTRPHHSPLSAAVSPPVPLDPVRETPVQASPPRGVEYEEAQDLECDQILSSVKTALASVGSTYSPHPEVRRLKKELTELRVAAEESMREKDFFKDELGMAQSLARRYKNLSDEQQNRLDCQEDAFQEALKTNRMLQEQLAVMRKERNEALEKQAQAELELCVCKSEVASSKRLISSHLAMEEKEAKIKSAEQILKHTMASHEGLLKGASEEEQRSVKLKKKLETAQELIEVLKEELRAKEMGLSEMAKMKEKLSASRITAVMHERGTLVMEEKQARADILHEQDMGAMEMKASVAATRAAFYHTLLAQEQRGMAELEATLLTTLTSKDKAIAIMNEMQQAHSMVQAETDSTRRQLITGTEIVQNEVSDLRDQTALLRRRLEEANDKILEKEEEITNCKRRISEMQKASYSKKKGSPHRYTTAEALRDAMEKMAKSRQGHHANTVLRERYPYKPFYNENGWVHAPGRATSSSPRRSSSPKYNPPPLAPASPPDLSNAQYMCSIEREPSTTSLSTMSTESTPCARGADGMPSPLTAIQRIGVVSPAPHP